MADLKARACHEKGAPLSESTTEEIERGDLHDLVIEEILAEDLDPMGNLVADLRGGPLHRRLERLEFPVDHGQLKLDGEAIDDRPLDLGGPLQHGPTPTWCAPREDGSTP